MGITDPTGIGHNISKGTQLHQELRLENVSCLKSFIHSFPHSLNNDFGGPNRY